MRAFVYYLHTVRRVGKRGGKYLLLHLRKCDILGVECGPETWRRGGRVRGGSFHFSVEGRRAIFCKITISKLSLLLEIGMIIFLLFFLLILRSLQFPRSKLSISPSTLPSFIHQLYQSRLYRQPMQYSQATSDLSLILIPHFYIYAGSSQARLSYSLSRSREIVFGVFSK